MNYQTIYKGSIITDSQDYSILTVLRDKLLKIDLPWDTEVMFSIDTCRGFLSFCALLDNKERCVLDAVSCVVQMCEKSSGAIYCYGDHSHDIRRFVVAKGRVYEQKAEVEYEEPGRVVFLKG